MTQPWWFQALTLALNAVQTVALAYVYSRWRRVDGQFARHIAGDDHAAGERS